MEQKKTLWIVAAAGIFLLVVVGAALIIYSPSLHNAPVQQASFDPSTGWVNASALSGSSAENSVSQENPAAASPDAFAEQTSSPALPASPFDPLAQSPASTLPKPEQNASSSDSNTNAVINTQNVNVYAQGTTTFDLNALKAASSSSAENNSNVTAQNEKTAEQLAKASEQKSEARNEPENYYAPSSRASKPAAVAKSAPAASSKPAAKSSAASPSSAKSNAASKSSASTAKKVADASKTPANLFWVQVGAYSSKKNADSARETLEQNKIPVEVFTDGKYYKVRAGSFTTKSEAIYWQKMISEIGKFSGSKTMVVNSAVQK